MLTFQSDNVGKFCDGLSRRDFLKVGSLGLGASALNLTDLSHMRAQAGTTSRARQKSVIMVYLFGGPSHIDTYDMKPDAPVEYRGQFNPAQTNVPGIQFCELMPRQAQIADKFSIIRNMVFAGEHSPIYLFGTRPLNGNTRVAAFPAVGSALSKVWTDNGLTRTLPGPCYVSFDNYNLFTSFLGPAHGPFIPAPLRPMPPMGSHPDIVPVDRLSNLELTSGLSLERIQDRTALLRYFDTLNRELDGPRGAVSAMDASQNQALSMLTDRKIRDAFDATREPMRLREAYGKVPQLLLARRLVEAGVPMVQLTINGRNGQGHYQLEPLDNGWDTHGNNFRSLSGALPMYDQSISTFMNDLYDRGLYDDVIVVIWGEMGRTPRVNGSAGRDHWTECGFALVAGGGCKMGQVVGATDRLASRPAGRPYTPQNVLSLVYRHLGIDLARTTITDSIGRPHYLLQDTTPVVELL